MGSANKFLIFTILFFVSTRTQAQYKTFDNLQENFEKQQYEKCIAKAEKILEDDSKEIYPSYWQMMCYLKLHEMQDSELQKTALSKALNFAIRIKRKDKLKTLLSQHKSDFELLIETVLAQAQKECANQKEKAILRYNKLLEWDTNANYILIKINCLGSKEIQTTDASVIENLMVKNYNQFLNKDALFTNQENLYAFYLQYMLQQKQIEAATDVYEKAIEVYKATPECNKALSIYFEKIISTINIESESENRNVLEQLNAFNKIEKLNFAPALENKINLNIAEIEINKVAEAGFVEVPASMQNYFNYFGPNKQDSCNSFFYTKLTKDNQPRDALFYLWTKLQTQYANATTDVAIKNIHNYVLQQKNNSCLYDYLNFCNKIYSKQNPMLVKLRKQLDDLVVAKLNNKEIVDSLDLINKIALSSGNKLIKDKHLLSIYNNLQSLLQKKDYPAFVHNMQNALGMYKNNVQLLALKKEFVVQDFLQNFATLQANNENKFSKLPDANTCYEGVVNEAGHASVLQAINYVRRLVGIANPCKLDAILNNRCQKAALIMMANGNLDHHPPKTWKCLTDEGVRAAGYSNLSLGNTFYDAIFSQLDDGGDNNYSCGHRRWILNPGNYIFGHGSTNNTMVLSTFGSSNLDFVPIYKFNDTLPICWPAQDFFPQELIARRWSFSMRDIDFDDVKVVVLENGKPIPVTLEKQSQGYGYSAIVFVPAVTETQNKSYTVTISNMKRYNYATSKADVLLPYIYKVSIINPE